MAERRTISKPKSLLKPGMALHLKYRPKTLDEVIGQPAIVASLKKVLAKGEQHAYLFTGGAGCGKTTLARICADMLGVDAANVTEVDAASNSGVDAMREIVSATRYLGFGAKPGRAVIIDEAHNLSKSAWDALLKPMEEPPAHVYFMLCTTNAAKVPATIATRCQSYKVLDVAGKALGGLLARVCDAEGYDTTDDVLDRIVGAAMGSPRRALTLLATVAEVENLADVDDLLAHVNDAPEVIDLCRAIVSRAPWVDLMTMVKALPVDNAEGTRIVVCRYLASCAMGAKNERVAEGFIDMLDYFSQPFNASDGSAPLVRAISHATRSSRRG
jgi:DNA polymerase III gamma/tau subunit